MTATAEIYELSQSPAALVDERHQHSPRLPALTFVAMVGLISEPVDPSWVVPAALILKSENLIDLQGITFGSNYELDVRSIELDHGLVDALDLSWLRLSGGKVTVSPHATLPAVPEDLQQRARALFDLNRDELVRDARHHLLREAEDRRS